MTGAPMGRLLFVNYHYIRDAGQHEVASPGEARFPGIHPLAPAGFAKQIAWLADRFHMASPDEAEAFVLGRGMLPGPSVALTFDDGLADHWAAAEVVERAGARGAFFIASRPIADGQPLLVHKDHWLRATTPADRFLKEFDALLPAQWRADAAPAGDTEAAAKIYVYDSAGDALLKYRINFQIPHGVVDSVTTEMLAARARSGADFWGRTYMDAGAIQSLHAKGHTIAAHGHGHMPFSRLGGGDLAADVKANLQCLEAITGARPRWISYPYGRDWAVPRDTVGFCRRFGFSVGLTLKAGWNEAGADPTRLSRINTNEVSTVAEAGLAADA